MYLLYISIKTVDRYNDTISVITNWGDKAVLKEASSDDPQAAAIRKFCKSNTRGYNYVRHFEVEEAETSMGPRS